MTKILKLEMRGFKTFAKKTELLMGDHFNVVLGPNGSGKCLDYNALVQLADGSTVKIGELVESRLKTNPVCPIDDGFIIQGDGTSILSMDTKTLALSPKPIAKFVKRTAPEHLLKIRTRSGREVTATEYHPLFVLKEGKVQSINAEHLTEGTKVAVPRQLPLHPQTKTFFELLDLVHPEDMVYVPYEESLKTILLEIKRKQKQKASWNLVARQCKVPENAIRGVIDEQSVNFAYLVRLLRWAGKTDEEIISLIPHCKSKTGNNIYSIPWHNSPELARFFGYLTAEGRLPPQSDQIWFVNGTEEIAQDYTSLVSYLFGIKPLVAEYKENAYDIIFYSSPLRVFLEKLGMGVDGTINKKITNLFLMHSSSEELGNFLDGLYSGDGTVSESSIDLTTKSFELARGVETMLLRLGILFTTTTKIKMATNSGFVGKYRMITISGQENMFRFGQCVNLTHPQKRKRLAESLGKKINPNLDLLEVNALIKDACRELGISLKKMKKEFPRLEAYAYHQCTPSRYGVQYLIHRLFDVSVSGRQQQSMALLTLKKLAFSDIYWDEIVEIETIPSQHPFVYDLTVDEHHNFIANNIIVHNSNVLDAICFVLGKAGSKGLRAEKSANLIYNGGKTKNPAKDAEVSIYFDNKDGLFPIKSEAIKITRIIRQNGQSDYKINDTKRTRQQVLDLLSIARINPEGHSIVLQGDIIRFIDMQPITRRLLIEEIAGISIYEEKKQKALSELNKVDEKLKESDIIMKERETHLGQLQHERDQALKYRELTDSIKQHKASYHYLRLQAKLKEKEAFDKQIAEKQKEVDTTQKLINSIKEQINAKKEDIKKISKEIEDKGDKEQNRIQKEIEQLKIDTASNTTRVASLKNEIVKIKQRSDQLKANIQEIEDRLKDIAQKQKDLASQKSKSETERKFITKKLEDFKAKHQLEETESIDKDIVGIDKELDDKQKEIQQLREAQQNLLREKDRLEYQVQGIDEKIEKVLTVEKQNQNEIEQLKQKKQEFKKTTLDLNKLLNEDASFAAQLHNAKSKLSSSEEELSKIMARSAGMRENIAGNIAITKILEQKKNIGGIYGTVAELGNVSSKYSLALEIAAGKKLKSIVVDTDAIAARCIAYLKQNKYGVASFIPLNKIKGSDPDPASKKLLQTDGVHDFAVNLVKFDSKFKKVFSYVFGSTLVVETIETARKVGIGSAKMVTLEGDVADTSGVMQGGFREKTRGSGFREKEMDDKLHALEEDVARQQTIIDTLQKKRQETEETITRYRELKATLEGEIIKAEKSLHLESSDLEVSKQQKQEFRQKLGDMDKEIGGVQQKITALNSSLATLKMKKQQLRDKIAQLKNPVLLAELNTFEQKLQQLKEQNITTDADINNLENQRKSILLPEKEKIQKIIQQHEKEEKDFIDETQKLEERIKKDSITLKEKEKMQKEFYDQYKGLFSSRNKFQEELQKLEEKLYKTEELIRGIETKMNLNSLENARIKAELAGLEEEGKQYEGVKILQKPEAELKKHIDLGQRDLEKIGSVNIKALEVYDQVEAEYKKLVEKQEILRSEKKDVLVMINEIDTRKKELFMKTFDVLNANFTKIFAVLSTKGEASLDLENSEDPFEAGVLFKVRLSGKKYLDIKSLSGGEKTLTALSFIFAIQEHDPASFYVFDEVDAALDKRNSEKLAKLVRKYSNNAQYVIISHNDALISEADNLYGVSIDEFGVSKVVSLKV